MERVIAGIRNAPRWVFLGALIYAPWAYGCTTAETIVILNYLLAGVIGSWLLVIGLTRRMPFVSPGLTVAATFILVLGWGMTLNAHAVYDPAFHIFMALPSYWPRMPGSYDQVNSIAFMVRCTLLVFSMCFVADLVQRPVWLLRLWYAIGLAGASIALLGLVQKASGAQMIFWQPSATHWSKNFFATFYYHANAGAYLNLVFPVTIGLAARSLARGQHPGVRAVWLTAAILVTVAILANTSRAAQLIGILLMISLAISSVRHVGRVFGRAEKAPLLIGGSVALLAIFAVAQASRLDQPLKRWQDIASQLPKDARWDAVETALPAAQEAGWFGFGPGTFRSIFPRFAEASGNTVEGIWRFLHQDYLQTVLEWGWVGSLALGGVMFGGMGAAFRNWRKASALSVNGYSLFGKEQSLRRGAEDGTRGRVRSPEEEGQLSVVHGPRASQAWLPRQRMLLPLILLALGSVALHALVDFPLQIASIQLYVATYLGICWGSAGWTRERKPAG